MEVRILFSSSVFIEPEEGAHVEEVVELKGLRPELSEIQKGLLSRMWIKDDFEWLFNVGMNIYTEIFNLDESMKMLFPYVAELEGRNEDIKLSKQFRAQALRFVQVLEVAITNLDNPDPKDFNDVLFELGQRHQKLIERGFKAEYWKIFEMAVANVMQRECDHSHNYKLTTLEKINVIEAWKILSRFIIQGLTIGFNHVM